MTSYLHAPSLSRCWCTKHTGPLFLLTDNIVSDPGVQVTLECGP